MPRARFVTHSFVRHAHDEFVIAVFEQGAERFEADGATRIAEAGSVLVIPPGVSHTGSAAAPGRWTYRAFYPRPEAILELRTQVLQRDGRRLPPLPLHQIHDRELHSALVATHRAFETGAPPLERQSRMLSAFSRLLSRVETREESSARFEALAVRRVRQYLEECFLDEIGIDELADVAGLSASYVMRCFQRQVGVSMHSYLTGVRLRHARDMLIRGEPAAEVAFAVGFVDQSHLIRRFKAIYGATPGGYASDSRVAYRSFAPTARRFNAAIRLSGPEGDGRIP